MTRIETSGNWEGYIVVEDGEEVKAFHSRLDQAYNIGIITQKDAPSIELMVRRVDRNYPFNITINSVDTDEPSDTSPSMGSL